MVSGLFSEFEVSNLICALEDKLEGFSEGKQAAVVDVPGQEVFAVEGEGDRQGLCELCRVLRGSEHD